MIQPSSIQEVMNRADLAEIVGQFVRLKKRGSNYIGNCPFHNEKTPSFSVSQTKGIYKCFGCGKAGNVVTFLQDHEKLSYPEAVRWLADYYKIELQESERTVEQIQQGKIEESLRVINEFATQWFHNYLLNEEEGQAIGGSYFKQRGFRKTTIEVFRLGYCPEDRDAFYKAATSAGYDAQLLEQAGLVKNRNGHYYDAYRGRVIFPIQSMTGRVLGFGARILKTNDRAPKYINTPENELYVKSKVLYGLYQSRQSIAKEDECLLTEGYTDVIALQQGGITNVVASSGTSLTEEQLRIIGRLTKRLLILYDGDAAGIKAAMRGMNMALSQGINVQLVLLPEGHDPDSFIQEKGEAAFRAYVQAHKKDIVRFRMEVGMKEVAQDPIAKSKLVNEIAESIAQLNKAEDFSLQDFYIKEAADTLQVDIKGMTTLVNQFIRSKVEADRRHNVKPEYAESASDAPDPEPIPEIDTQNIHENQEWQLIKVLINQGEQPIEGYEHVAEYIYAHINPQMIDTPAVQRLYEIYYDYISQYQILPGIKYFVHFPDDSFQEKLSTVLQERYEVSPNWKHTYGIETFHGELNYINEVQSTIHYYEWKKLRRQQMQLIDRMQKEKDEQVILQMQQVFITLKQQEKEILQKVGTVIAKS